MYILKKFYSENCFFCFSFFFAYTLVFFGWPGNTAVTATGFLLIAISLGITVKKGLFFQNFLPLAELFQEKLYRRIYLIFGFLWIINVFLFYFFMEYKTMDTGWFFNPIENFFRHREFYNSFYKGQELSDHFYPIYIPVAYLLNIYNSFIWLNLIKALSFIVAPYVLLKISKEILPPDSKKIYITPLLWMIHEYMANTMFFDFQPSSGAVVFILLAFYFMVRKKYSVGIFFLCLLPFFKENLPFIWLSVGIYLVLYQRKIILGSLIFLCGVAFGLLILKLIPFISGDSFSHTGRLGPFALFPQKICFVFLILASVFFLPLFSFRSIFFILPAFATNLLANVPAMVGFNYHYADIGIPVLFVGAIHGLQNIESGNHLLKKFDLKKQSIAYAVILFLFFTQNTLLPQHGIRRVLLSLESIDYFTELRSLQKELNENYRVYATGGILTYLSFFPDQRLLRDFKEREKPGYRSPAYVIFAKNKKYDMHSQEDIEVVHKIDNFVKSGELSLFKETEHLSVYISEK